MTNRPSAYKKLTQVQRILGFWPAVFKGVPADTPTVLGGARVRAGNRVSAFGNRTKRRFKPNVVLSHFHSELLGETVRMRVTARVQKTIHKKGGLDNYLLLSRERDHVCEHALALRKRIEEAFLARGVASLRVGGPEKADGGADPAAEASDLADFVPAVSFSVRPKARPEAAA